MKKIVLNLETGEYEPIKPHKRPTCCVPGCERKAHNLVGKGKYEPRVNTAYGNIIEMKSRCNTVSRILVKLQQKIN